VEEEGAAVELEAGVRELAEEPGERNVGALVVLLCTKDKALASCSKLSTATARWRPSRASGSRGACKRGQRRGENRAGAGGEGRVEVDQAGGGATAAAQRRRQGALHRRQGGQSRAARARGGRRKGGPRGSFGKSEIPGTSR
jgi:hypothetical protein